MRRDGVLNVENIINRLKLYEEDDKINSFINKIIFAIEFLNHGEIAANTNQLTGELKDLKANRYNYKEIFNKTKVGFLYNAVIIVIEELFNDDTIDWNRVFKFIKEHDCIDVYSNFYMLKNGNIFRKKIYKYLMYKKEYCYNQFQKSIAYVIGGYKGKDQSREYNDKLGIPRSVQKIHMNEPNRIYSTHNKSITNCNKLPF